MREGETAAHIVYTAALLKRPLCGSLLECVYVFTLSSMARSRSSLNSVRHLHHTTHKDKRQTPISISLSFPCVHIDKRGPHMHNLEKVAAVFFPLNMMYTCRSIICVCVYMCVYMVIYTYIVWSPVGFDVSCGHAFEGRRLLPTHTEPIATPTHTQRREGKKRGHCLCDRPCVFLTRRGERLLYGRFDG